MNDPAYPTYSDEYLEFWGDVYLANKAALSARGILFQMFLSDPIEILIASVFSLPWPLRLSDGFEPLLPRQQAMQLQVFTEEMDEEMARHERAFRESVRQQWLADLDELQRQLEQITRSGICEIRRSNGRIIEPLTHHAHPKRRCGSCAFRRASV